MGALPLGVPPRQAALAVGLGLLGAAAFPPVSAWPFLLLSSALFLFLLRDQDLVTARNLALCYGLTFGLGTMYWLFAVFGARAISLVALMAGYFWLLATLVAWTRGQRPLPRAALVAMFAIGVEWLRGDAWYLRFPWYTPAHALAMAPAWTAAARWLGTYGLSYVVWFIAGLGAFGRAQAWAAFLLLPLAGVTLPAVPRPDRQVVLMQYEGGEVSDWLMGLVGDQLLADNAAGPADLVVLPEYAYQRSPESVLANKGGLAGLARRLGCPVVFGAVEGDYASLKFFNVAAVSDADGRLLGTFPKQRPVPLMADGIPGDRRPVFPLEQGVLGVGVCYDLDAPAVAGSLVQAGATVLVAPTFDAMSWTPVQHVHHELLLRLRAVESDRWILRAASSGRSEVIDPRGVPSEEGVEIGREGVVKLPFAHRATWTLGSRLYPLGPAAAAGSVLFAVIVAARDWRSRRREERIP